MSKKDLLEAAVAFYLNARREDLALTVPHAGRHESTVDSRPRMRKP